MDPRQWSEWPSESFSVNAWFCFLLEPAWYLEMYLYKELTCDWILRLQGACLQEQGAGALLRFFSSCRCRGGALPEVTGPPQRSFLPRFYESAPDCYLWGMEIWLLKTDHGKESIYTFWTLKRMKNISKPKFLQWTLKNFGTSFLWGTPFQRTETEALLSLYSFLFLDLLNIFCGVKWLIKNPQTLSDFLKHTHKNLL